MRYYTDSLGRPVVIDGGLAGGAQLGVTFFTRQPTGPAAPTAVTQRPTVFQRRPSPFPTAPAEAPQRPTAPAPQQQPAPVIQQLKRCELNEATYVQDPGGGRALVHTRRVGNFAKCPDGWVEYQVDTGRQETPASGVGVSFFRRSTLIPTFAPAPVPTPTAAAPKAPNTIVCERGYWVRDAQGWRPVYRVEQFYEKSCPQGWNQVEARALPWVQQSAAASP